MANETADRPAGGSDARHAHGGSGAEHAPLQARAAFIQNWSWESVLGLNRGACERGRAQHGLNSETHEKVRRLWEETRSQSLTLLETIEFLFRCHRSAPFLFFNGNTFAEIARRLVDVLFADLPLPRRREAASLTAHFVAGVLDRESMIQGVESLCELADLKPGDRVRTLKGSLRGTVKRILPDGRIAWKPDSSSNELLALPESLLRAK